MSAELTHWVGENNNTIHGNGAGSKDMERTSDDEDEVTCKLCLTLLEKLARENADAVASHPSAVLLAGASVSKFPGDPVVIDGAEYGIALPSATLTDAEREAITEGVYDAYRLGCYSESGYQPMWHELDPKPTGTPEACAVARAVERIVAERVAAERADALREAADEMWRIFLRLPHTPSPLGDYIQRRVNDLRERAHREATR